MPIVSPEPVPVLLTVSANPAEQAIGTVLVPMGYNPHCRQWGHATSGSYYTLPIAFTKFKACVGMHDAAGAHRTCVEWLDTGSNASLTSVHLVTNGSTGEAIAFICIGR